MKYYIDYHHHTTKDPALFYELKWFLCEATKPWENKMNGPYPLAIPGVWWGNLDARPERPWRV